MARAVSHLQMTCNPAYFFSCFNCVVTQCKLCPLVRYVNGQGFLCVISAITAFGYMHWLIAPYKLAIYYYTHGSDASYTPTNTAVTHCGAVP